MKKTKFYLIIPFFLFLLVLSACSKKEEVQEEFKEKEVKEQEIKEDELLNYSLKDLLEKDESLYCVSLENTEEAEIKTSFYIDNQKQRMRSNSEVKDKLEGLNYSSSFILEDNWLYMWNDLMIMDGMKFYIEEDESDSEALDMDQDLELSCQAWQVDDSIFNLPSDINFSDMSEFLEQLKEIEMPEM